MGVLLCDILDGSASSLAREIVDSGGTPLPSRRCHAALFLPLWCPLATVDVGVASSMDGAARGGIGHGRRGSGWCPGPEIAGRSYRTPQRARSERHSLDLYGSHLAQLFGSSRVEASVVRFVFECRRPPPRRCQLVESAV